MSEGEERLRSAAKAVSEIMLDGKFRLSLAESFTGGAVSAALVGIAGTSGFLLESAVCYSNEAKCLRLGVKKETLASYGAVSPEVAEEMVKGLLTSSMRPDFAAATTGNAGPGVRRKIFGGRMLRRRRSVGRPYRCKTSAIIGFQGKQYYCGCGGSFISAFGNRKKTKGFIIMEKKNKGKKTSVIDSNMSKEDKAKALEDAIAQIEKTFGKGSIMKMTDSKVDKVEVISSQDACP